MSLIITDQTLKKMDLCGNHHSQNAIKFVGELREITPGNILCALEQGVDVFYFLDYWMRAEAGKGRGVGPKGPVQDNLLWIYDDLIDNLNEIFKNPPELKGLSLPDRAHFQNSLRAMVYYRAFEALWVSKRWAL